MIVNAVCVKYADQEVLQLKKHKKNFCPVTVGSSNPELEVQKKKKGGR